MLGFDLPLDERVPDTGNVIKPCAVEQAADDLGRIVWRKCDHISLVLGVLAPEMGISVNPTKTYATLSPGETHVRYSPRLMIAILLVREGQ